MESTFRPGRFAMDCLEGEIFTGYTEGDTRNGWACPAFEYDEAMRLRDLLAAQGDDDLDDDWKPSDFMQHTGLIDGKVRTVYAVGAFSWIWEEVTE